MAEEALGLHIYGMEKDGEALPERTDGIPDLADGDVAVSVFPVFVREEMENRRKKTTVTIPRWLKTAAEAEGGKYSRLLEAAIKEQLGIAS